MAKKILIVDDEVHIRRIIADKISKAGYIALLAENGQEAVELAKKEKPALILMDIMMPVMGGIEAAKILKQDSELADIPVFILTAMELGEMRIEVENTGINGIITKPFSPKELIDTIKARIGD